MIVRTTTRFVLCTIGSLLVGVSHQALGQTCEPSTSSNEAKIFGNRSLALAAGRGAPVAADPAGTIRAGVEFVMLPHVSDATATPTTCRPGKGPENVNALPGVARASVSASLGAGITATLRWLPPVTLSGMRGNLLSVAAGYTRGVLPGVAFEARAYATFGNVTGPITCPDDAVRDPASECHNGTRSSDRFDPNIRGIDIAAGGRAHGAGLAWYGGAGYESLTPRFQVHFLNAAGFLDTTRVRVDLTRVTLFAGASWTPWSRTRLTGEVFATPDDGATVRVVVDTPLWRLW